MSTAMKKDHLRISSASSWKDAETLLCCRFDPAGNFLLYGGFRGALSVRNLRLDSPEREVKVTDRSPVMCIENFQGDKNTFFATDLQLSVREVFRLIHPNNEVLAIETSKDNRYMVTGHGDGSVRIYDVESRKLIKEHPRGNMAIRGHGGKVCDSLCIDGYNTFLTGGWDRNFIIWDVRQPDCVDQFIGVKVCGSAMAKKQGNILVGLSTWDLTRRAMVEQISWREDSESGADVYSLVCSKKKEEFFVAGTITTGELQVFEKGAIGYFPTWTVSDVLGGVMGCDLSLKEDKIAFVTGTKSCKAHILSIGKLI